MNEVVVKEQTSLDELMLAMDVVDTLRHKELMLAREVEADDREQRLLTRLREIYTAQGITVSDDVLKQGVQALQEERFVFHAAPPSLSRSLAKVYVTRGRWGKWATAAVAAIIVGVLGVQYGYLAPREHALAALPTDLQSAYQAVVADTQEATALTSAQQLLSDGQAALAEHDMGTARGSIAALRALDFKLREEYEIKIVSRPGVRSGVYRVPDDNRRTRNYYLIVEAIAPNGRALPMPIRSEEDGKVKRVSLWGLRVDEATYNRVAADKRDDGIIEHDVIGEKRRGTLEPEYSVATTGAAITKW